MVVIAGDRVEQDELNTLRKRVEELEMRNRQFEENALTVAGQQCLLEMIAKGSPLQEILEAIALFIEERSRDIFCSILILDSAKSQLRRGATPSLPASFVDAVDGLFIGPEAGSCGRCAYLGQQVISTDIASDPYWKEHAQWIIDHYDLRSCWSTPISNGQGDVLGTFAMYSKTPRAPIPQEFAFADIATRLAAIAIERNRIETEFLLAKERAEAASNAKNIFLANMGHELRTPLNAILGYSDLLKEELGTDPQGGILSDINSIQTAARNLFAIIVNILDIVKLDAGKIVVTPSCFDVSVILDKLAAHYAPILKKKNNRLEIHRDGNLELITSDQEKITRVLDNLLGNANKFTHNGSIALTVRQESTQAKEWLVFDVEDTGIGMDDQQITYLFESFYQGDPSATRQHEGAGLGLAICFRLCRLLHGFIEARSTLGKGSTFTVRLPIHATDPD